MALTRVSGNLIVSGVTLTSPAITGNLTLSGGTANGVTFLNGSKVLTSGSALVFDGTNMGIGTASPATKLDVSSATSVATFTTTQTSGNAVTINVDGGSGTPVGLRVVAGIGTIDSTAKLINVVNSAGDNLFNVQVSGVIGVGSGIAFPATQLASSNANTLDDYEEGTWTPVLAFGGNSVGITFTTSYNNSSYTKIGSRVFVSGITSLTSKGSSTGNATLKSLPFSPSGVPGFSAVTLALSGVTFTGQYSADLDANDARINFSQTSEAGVSSALTNTNFSNSSSFVFSFSYFTS